MNKVHSLNNISVADGIVYINFDKIPSKDRVDLKVSGQSVPFYPSNEENPIHLSGGIGRNYFDWSEIATLSRSEPAEITPGDRYALWMNNFKEWALSGEQTAQLMISKPHEPCKIYTGIELTAKRSETPLFFKAFLATHRANAHLYIDIVYLESGKAEQKKIKFDLKSRGGTTVDGYQSVSVPLSLSNESAKVSLSISYESFKDDGSETEPFMFIAGAHIGPKESSKDALAIIPQVALSASKLVPGGWMTAQYPSKVHNGESIEVLMNGSVLETISVPELSVKILEDYGHTLIIESSDERELRLYVDGVFTEVFRVNKGDTVLRVPSQYLDGAIHQVQMKDKSGSYIYVESLILVPYIITPPEIIQRESFAPFPDAIFAQTTQRFSSVKRQIANGDPKTDFKQISYALSVLEAGYDKVKLKPLAFPKVDRPDVSIVIPAHNKVEVTYLALCSLLVAHNHATFEVIVVDDASTDETAELENFVSGITVVHNEEAQRFIRACNAGAARARGQYVVLLNNDVEVTSGWLDELLATFDRFDRVGLAGSKLLYPDGKLQDAGGIIWGNGNPWNYGNGQNPNAPNFSYARQADYLSGAALMVPIDLWHEVGGLSSYLEPMYFEDTDLSFKIREAGYTTWFTPSSVVYHYEGMTSGTDTSKGFKKFQEVNRPNFKRRWANDYRTFGQEGHRPDLEKDRGVVGRVLFIDYTTPREDHDAGSYAALVEMRLAQSLGYKVSFLPMNMAHLGGYTEALQKMGVEVIYAPFFMSPTDYLTSYGQDFDAFYITRYYVANNVLSQIRAVAPHARVIFNNADLHFLRELRAARAQGDVAMLEKAKRTRDEELAIIRQVDAVLSYNNVEHSVIDAYTDGAAKVLQCPWVVEVPKNPVSLKGRSGLSFLGGFKHHPNEDGVRWFAQSVSPLLPERDAYHLSIYGSSMTEGVKKLKSPKVSPIGFVQDVSSAFDKHRIFVAPLLSGAGIKGKVLSALAHGAPCVLTPIAAEGIGLRSGHDCIISETAEEWRDAIVSLSEDDELWMKLSQNAQEHMRAAFSFERGRDLMRKAFEAVDLFRSKS